MAVPKDIVGPQSFQSAHGPRIVSPQKGGFLSNWLWTFCLWYFRKTAFHQPVDDTCNWEHAVQSDCQAATTRKCLCLCQQND